MKLLLLCCPTLRKGRWRRCSDIPLDRLFFVIIIDELVRSRKRLSYVIPAEAGIQKNQRVLDPGLRRGDGLEDFYETTII